MKVPDFTATQVKAQLTTTKKVPKNNSQQSFAKLLVVAQKRSIDLQTLLTHEVGAIPLSLFDENGNMRKTQKS